MSASVKESLQLQLLEMEMLFSMFPNQGEVKLEDVNALTNIKRYLEGTREALPPKIEFVITLQIEEPKRRLSGSPDWILSRWLHTSMEPSTFPW